MTLDVSREASLQMDSAPVAGATELVSLWQNGFIAMKAERFINWKRRRVEGVQYISGAAYGDAAQAG
ncbi:phage-like protein [Burkholderia pseudomallei]|nr:phage-like protein [Burkholderia pseudomallei]